MILWNFKRSNERRAKTRRFFFCGLFVIIFSLRGLALQAVPLKVGDLVEDFEIKNRANESIRLSSLKGNFVILNFWATWCPPCIQELPFLELLNQRLKTKPVTMIGVSVDDSWGVIDEFFDKIGRLPSFPIVLDSKHILADKFGTHKFPETYVLDKQGRVIEKIVGAIDLTDPKKVNQWESFLTKTE